MNTDEELGNRVHEPAGENRKPSNHDDLAREERAETGSDLKRDETPNRSDDVEPSGEGSMVTSETGSDTEDSIPYLNSIAPQDLNIVKSIIGEYDDYVPLDSLEDAVDELRRMATVVEVYEGEIVSLNVDDGWQTEEVQTLNNLLARDAYFRPVRIVGRISRSNPVTAFELPDGETTSLRGIEIEDTQGTTIESLEFQAKCLMTDLERLHRERIRCIFFGTIVPFYPKKKTKQNKPKPRFYLHDISTDVSPIDLVPWTPTVESPTGFGVVVGGRRNGIPADHPYSILKAHPETNGIVDYIKQEIARGLQIQALSEARELERSLEFVILQALSQGRSGFLEKLHGLIIGPPNVGKSYLTRAALILNTVGQEISSSGRKVTIAGLVGTVKSKSKRNVSEPGILPLNHEGVVCIQEFHEVRGETRKAVCGVFIRMMEEGQVVESTTADTIHPTETALLLDMNRYSQIDPSGTFNSFSDIDIPVNMLARFDYIVDIPRNQARSEATAADMTENFEVMGRSAPAGDEPWQMRLKYLIAFLRSEYNVIENPDDVRDYIRSKVTAMLAEVPEHLQSLVEDMRLRIVRSAFKLTKAVTTANASRQSTIEYADYALRFVQDKVNFIKNIHFEDIREEKPSINDMNRRHEIIEAKFRGKRFKPDEVLEHLSTKMDGEIDRKTIKRDLKALGGRPLTKPKGTWSMK